jgi:recombination protein RecT
MSETQKPQSQLAVFKQDLSVMQGEFKIALPPQIDPAKFVRTVTTAVQMNPELLTCDRKSILGACMKAAQDGLFLDGREAALVIFRTKTGPICQYMPMVGGIYKKMRNSGELATIAAHVVYEKDVFDYELGDDEKISHKPTLSADRGEPIAVYAIAKTKDGSIYREVMSVTEVEKVRSSSRASAAGPWSSWWSEMARKTVIRRIAKRLPSSADIEQVFESDNEVSGFDREVKQISAISKLNASLATGETFSLEAGDDQPESDNDGGDTATEEKE